MNFAYCSDVKGFLKKSDSQILNKLINGYKCITGSDPDNKQINSWKGMFGHLRKLFNNINQEIYIVMEYKLPFSSERIDLILFGVNDKGENTAIIFELKGWNNAQQSQNQNTDIVVVNSEIHRHPELQLLNYLGKLQYSHSYAKHFNIIGAIWAYNLPQNQININNVQAFFQNQHSEVIKFVNDNIKDPIDKLQVDNFLNGKYVQNAQLLQTIKNNFDSLKQEAYQTLCAKGFGPSEEQIEIISEIIEKVKNNEKCAYFISGAPGSGKSYIAVLLLLRALKEFSGYKNKNIAVLGYRNNRLINSIKKVFAQGLDSVIKFYSTGRNFGLAEGDPSNPHFKLVIYDEAQRMTSKNIEIALQRGDVTVFFYDENQILNADEEGRKDNFIEIAKKLGITCIEERRLFGVHRVQGGLIYHDFVEELLKGKNVQYPNLENYKFEVVNDIQDLLTSLRDRSNNGYKVALVAAFTESPGDRKNKTMKNIDNLRIGYPLKSGFSKYKGKNLEIYWLMDEKNQYPAFWLENESNKLEYCASIYGCQGFEADYIGVIWGRDLVWRDGRWELGDNCEDSVGKPSLKDLFNKAKNGNKGSADLAKELLINRYRIFLTRGILGTFIFCEDEETHKKLKSTIPQNGGV